MRTVSRMLGALWILSLAGADYAFAQVWLRYEFWSPDGRSHEGPADAGPYNTFAECKASFERAKANYERWGAGYKLQCWGQEVTPGGRVAAAPSAGGATERDDSEINNWINIMLGIKRQLDQQLDQQKQQRRVQQQRQEWQEQERNREQERIRELEERRAQEQARVQEAAAEACRQLKGAGCSPSELRLKPAQPSSTPGALPRSWVQLHCALYLEQARLRRVERGEWGEAQYLKEQKEWLINDRPLEVECPTPPPPPAVFPLAEATPEQLRLYVQVFENTRKLGVQLQEVNQAIQERNKKKIEVAQKIETKRDQLEEIQRKPVEPGNPSAEQAKRQRLAEAEEELRKAEQEAAENERVLQEATKQQAETEGSLKRMQQCFEEGKQNPTRAAELQKACGGSP